MVRSLYSGVAGMMTHQNKMDVIGNNVSNVSTYGYKRGRATFRDVYYQTNSAASASTPTRGGVNPTQIGYGAKLGSVDINHSQSVMSTTGYTLDVAIAGEGYLQVMDGDGNIFYSKAGMLDIDAAGNLVDVNGNFILGVSGNPTGKDPASNRIRISLPYENAKEGSVTDTINSIGYTITASNQNDASNVNIVFAASKKLPIGQKATATVTSSSIVVTLNANEQFTSMADLNTEVNNAIKTANGGVQHPGGDFTITMSNPSAFNINNVQGGLTGAEIVEADFGVNLGSATFTGNNANTTRQYFDVTTVGDTFSLSGTNNTFNASYSAGAGLTLSIGQYQAFVNDSQLASAGTVVLKKNPSTDPTDYLIMSYPSLSTINGTQAILAGLSVPVTATPSVPSANLGLGDGNFILSGGTEGGEQTVADLTGLSINDRGVLTGTHATFGLLELGQISLATFANPAGLTQVGNTYFSKSLNSGEPELAVAGTDGTGNILGGTLETSNTDLSQEFSDMITTQRGFQACSRLITVSDTMLEELINLKR